MFTGLKRIMNIETVFTRSKLVRAKYFWPSLTWPKYLNPDKQTGTLCHKMKPPYITSAFWTEKSFSDILFVLKTRPLQN